MHVSISSRKIYWFYVTSLRQECLGKELRHIGRRLNKLLVDEGSLKISD